MAGVNDGSIVKENGATGCVDHWYEIYLILVQVDNHANQIIIRFAEVLLTALNPNNPGY